MKTARTDSVKTARSSEKGPVPEAGCPVFAGALANLASKDTLDNMFLAFLLPAALGILYFTRLLPVIPLIGACAFAAIALFLFLRELWYILREHSAQRRAGRYMERVIRPMEERQRQRLIEAFRENYGKEPEL